MKNAKTPKPVAEPAGEAPELDGRSTRHEPRRREVMDQAVAYVLREGLAGLSIRPMAEALGISHRTLLHHFGSKEQLVARVLGELRTRQMEEFGQRGLRDDQDPLTMLDEAWKHVAAPERLPFWRAFFEIYGIAAKNPEQYGDFLDAVIKPWLAIPTRAAIRAGLSPARAESLATLMQAASRGLILDLLTTGDTRRVQRAHGLLREVVAAELAEVSPDKRRRKARS